LSALHQPLHLDAPTFRVLLEQQGPSLGLWRAAEVAALREAIYEHPVLDLGCGDGLVTSQVLSRVAIGLDPDTRALALATQQGVYERLEAVRIEDASIPEGSISTVLSNSVLEHVPRLESVLAAVARVLRPGGRLVFTVPTEAFRHWLALPLAGYATWRNRDLYHLNLWPIERWTRHLEQTGLKVEVVRPYLRQALVWIWDVLELLQQIWIARRRVLGVIWRRIPPSAMQRMARWASQLDLSASAPGGGQMIVACKR
jgi:SAM-dependent methyltransferase